MTVRYRRSRFDEYLLKHSPSHAKCIERRARLTVMVGTCDCPGEVFHAAIRYSRGEDS